MLEKAHKDNSHNLKILIAPFSGSSILLSSINDPNFFEIAMRVISDLPEGVWAHA